MFRGAVRADMAKILEVYARARDFMAKNGNPTQWGDSYPTPELLEEDIDTNRLFVYMINGQMQAVFAFVLGEDPTYQTIEDGQWLNDTLPYGTLHRLASAGESKGVGKAVVEWCLEHCESLRADTHADNKVMQHLLESEGFTRCGIIHVADGTPRIAYQRMSLTQRAENSFICSSETPVGVSELFFSQEGFVSPLLFFPSITCAYDGVKNFRLSVQTH